jgi:hypothetical protein
MYWEGGTINVEVNITDKITITNAATVGLNDILTINFGATMNWYAANINFNNGSLINNGTINAEANAGSLTSAGGSNVFNNNSGAVFKKTGGTITNAGIPVNNNGTFLVDGVNTKFIQSGSIFTNNLMIDVSPGSVFENLGGTLNLNNGTQVTGGGEISLTSASSHNINTTLTLPSPITIKITNGTLQGTGSLTVNKTMQLQGGAINTPVTMNGTSTLEVNNPTSVTLQNVLNIGNTATMNLNNTGNINANGATIIINGGMYINIDKAIVATGGTNAITVSSTGRITKNSVGTTTVGVPVNIFGSIGGIGTYSFTATSTNNGNISPGLSPGILTVNSTSPLFTSSSSLNIEIQDGTGAGTGHDQLQRAGSLVLDGTLNVLQIGTVPLGTYTIISLTSGTISGSFAVLNLPPGYTSGQTSNTFYVTKNADVLWKFRSKQSGDWSQLSTWELSTDGISWSNALQLPSVYNAELITIQSPHTVTLSTNTTVKKVVTESGATLNVSAGTLLITN